MNKPLLSFKYNRKHYKDSFINWLELVDNWVENDELSPLIQHFHRHYEISSEAVRQHLKRIIINAYDFVECRSKDDLVRQNPLKASARHFATLNYFLLFSSPVKKDKKKYKLMIDGIEDVDHELGVFSELIKKADFEIAFVSVNEKAQNLPDKKIVVRPFRKKYCRASVLHAIAIETCYGLKLYRHLSRLLGVDVYRLALSILNQYLYYYSLFSSIKSEYCLTLRDYTLSSIKRDIFSKFGGKAVCAVQRSRHGYIPLASFFDLDIHFTLGKWFSEAFRRQKGQIDLSIPIGSLLCEKYSSSISREKKYDLLYIESLGGNANLYDGYYKDCLEIYTWLVKVSKEGKNLSVAVKMRDHAGFCVEGAKDLLNMHNIQILWGDSYKIANSAKLIATYHSTMGFELMGMGIPVIFCNPGYRCSLLPDDPKFKKYSAGDYSEFFEKVKFMQAEPKKYVEEFEYFGKSSSRASNLILDAIS